MAIYSGCAGTKKPTILDKIKHLKFRFTKFLKYLFVRRLAIKIKCTGLHEDGIYSGYDIVAQKKIFEWQKMPKGFRWF